jgi:sodium-dependent dicarboxylate transporter 2/3/5
MLLAAFVSSTVVSVFVADTATTIIMLAIMVGILEEMNVEKGKSALGRAMMLLVPVGAYLGGMALISGSPGMNVLGISTLENATGGQFTIAYRDWAVIGIPSCLLLILPTWFIYVRFCGVSDKNPEKEIDPALFKKKLQDLGGITGSEIRWILTVLFMVYCMISGALPMMVAALLGALVTIFPIVGTVNPQSAMKGLPTEIVLMNAFIPTLGTIFANFSIGQWITTPFVPMLKGLSPLVLILVISYTMAILNDIFANASAGVIALVVAAFSPLCVEMGLNPSLIMIPAIILGSMTVILGTASCTLLSYQYGYWSMKDPLAPGGIVMLVWPFVISLVAYFVGPLFGISIYL